MPAYVLVVPSGLMLKFNALGPNTQARCEATADLWHSGRYDYVVTSGAICHGYDVQNSPAAFLMKDDLVQRGVPDDRILADWFARDTYENASGAVKILKRHEISDYRLEAVSQWQHTKRLWLAFRHRCDLSVGLHPLDWRFEPIEEIFYLYHLRDPLGNGRLAENTRKQRDFAWSPSSNP